MEMREARWWYERSGWWYKRYMARVSRKTGNWADGGYRIVRTTVFMHLIRISAAAFTPVYIFILLYSKYQYSIFVSLDIRAGRNDGKSRNLQYVFPDEACFARISLHPHLYYTDSFSTSLSSACFSTELFCVISRMFYICFVQNVNCIK